MYDAGTATSNSYSTFATGLNAVAAGTTSAGSSTALSFTGSPASFGIDSSATSTTATTDASYAYSESETEGYAYFHVTATGTYNTTGTASIALANTGSANYDVEGYVNLYDYSTGNVILNYTYASNGYSSQSGSIPAQVSLAAGQEYYLQAYSSAYSSQYYAAGTSTDSATGDLTLTAAAPEPSNLLFGGLACVAGIGYGWRRRRAVAGA